MKPLDRDLSILRHIISYCEQIEQTVDHFGNTYESFSTSQIYRNAVALCILQIGELVGKLTESFRTQNPAIPVLRNRKNPLEPLHRNGSNGQVLSLEFVQNR